MNIIFKYSEKTRLLDTYAYNASTNPIIAEIPVLPEVDTIPSLPDLTDLFEDETANDKVAIESVEKQDFIETPDLPDLDDLF